MVAMKSRCAAPFSTIKVRRNRTSDLTWQGWAMGADTLTFTMLLTVPRRR